MHADREIVHDAQRHSGAHGLGLSFGQLVVELPLQPAMEVDRGGVAGRERCDVRSVRMLQTGRPVPPVVPVLLRQRAPDREAVEGLSLPSFERRERELPAGRTRHPVDPLQGLAFGGPDGIPVDGCSAG